MTEQHDPSNIYALGIWMSIRYRYVVYVYMLHNILQKGRAHRGETIMRLKSGRDSIIKPTMEEGIGIKEGISCGGKQRYPQNDEFYPQRSTRHVLKTAFRVEDMDPFTSYTEI